MVRPDWCPQDVWEAAGTQLVMSDWPRLSVADMANAQPVVARAIIAERQRIADWADATADKYDSEAIIGAVGGVPEARAAERAVRGFAAAIRGASTS